MLQEWRRRRRARACVLRATHLARSALGALRASAQADVLVCRLLLPLRAHGRHEVATAAA